MRRRTLLALAGLLPLLPATALAQATAIQPTPITGADEAKLLGQIEAYLNSIHTLKARFLQIAPDGQQSGGTAWLERPGRMRFQYDPPSPFLLVAGHGLLVFHDSALDQTSNIPLGQTPLGILLAEHISLSGAGVSVTDLRRVPGYIQLTVIRTATPAEGSLTLNFTDNPLQLRSWTVLDAQGRQTQVTLFNIQLGGSFDASLFNYVDPNQLQGRPGNGG